MDAIIDNVLLTYVSYGLVLTSGKPEVLRAVSATFSEKEVADAKDVLWTQCLDHLGEKPNRNPSSLRSKKMENILDILDAVDELRNKCKMPRCVTDAIGMARWPTFTVSVVSGLDYKEQIQKLQDRCSALEASVNKNIQNISTTQKRSVPRGVQNYHPMQENVVATVEQPVVSGRKTEGTIDTVYLMEKDPGSCQDVSSDLETDSSGLEKRTYSAVITPSESGRLQNLAIPSVDTDEESGKWVKKVSRKHIIKGTATGSKIRGVRMTRRKSVIVYRLEDSVTMDMMNKHLVSNGIKGSKQRKMSSKDAIYTSYKVDIDAEYYDKICDSSLWGTDVHVRDLKKKW